MPDFWQEFIRPIPEEERHDLVAAYYKRLTGDNEIERMSAAKAWSIWEAQTASLRPRQEIIDHFANPYTAMSLARIECHYFMNRSFLEDNQILRDADRLADIPGIIVHGRYDVICPLENAWQLHAAWPRSELQIIENAGHAASEPGIIDALVRATSRLGREFG